MIITISKQAARIFLLRKQLLLPPYQFSKSNAVDTVFKQLRLIQYDPLNPCGRNTDLVLQARISDYHPEAYFDWLYHQRKGIECYDKELCIVLLEDFSLVTLRQKRAAGHLERSKFLEDHNEEISHLIEKIEREGPITSGGVEFKKQITGDWSENSTFGRYALETLWRLGRLVVVKRENGKKYYDLPNKVLGEGFAFPDKDLVSMGKEHLLRRLQSVGILPLSGSGGGWQGLGEAKEKTRLIKELIANGQLIEVAVEGSKRRYVISAKDEDNIRMDFHLVIKHKCMSFIAPLDNLMWDRDMVEEFFGFNYRWEVYTPVQKRKYGYYVLPILYGDRFIGRIEPVFSKDKILEIRGFWMEDKKFWDRQAWEEFSKCLSHFQKYLGASEIIKSPAPDET